MNPLKPMLLLAAGLLLATASYAQTRPQPEMLSTRQAQAERLAPAPEAKAPIRIVCSTPLTPKPLYVVDKQPITEEQMKSLEPSQIERLDILKGEKATTQFGAAGANGVVIITMKK